jgi:hypothetical protein
MAEAGVWDAYFLRLITAAAFNSKVLERKSFKPRPVKLIT